MPEMINPPDDQRNCLEVEWSALLRSTLAFLIAFAASAIALGSIFVLIVAIDLRYRSPEDSAVANRSFLLTTLVSLGLWPVVSRKTVQLRKMAQKFNSTCHRIPADDGGREMKAIYDDGDCENHTRHRTVQ